MRNNLETAHNRKACAAAIIMTAMVTLASAQTPGTLRWALKAPAHIFSSPAIAQDGSIYVAVGTDHDALHAGWLYSLAKDGTTNWAVTFPKYVRSSPAIGRDGRIYLGCMSGELKIVQTNGQYRPIALGGTPVGSAAIAADGTVYLGILGSSGLGKTNNLLALTPDGDLLWTFKLGGGTDPNSLPEQFSSPAIGPDGTIYVGSIDNHLYSISAKGQTNWVFPLNSLTNSTTAPTYSSPGIGPDGTIYIGADNGLLYAISPNGTRKWEFPVGGIVESSPSIAADGTIYVGSLAGNLVAINPDGTLKWNVTTGGISSSPALAADGTIYVGTFITQQLLAIDPAGNILWTLPTALGTTEYLFSSPVIDSDGTVYVGSGTRLVAAYGSAGPMAGQWTTFRANQMHTARAVQQQIGVPVATPSGGWELPLVVEPGLGYEVQWSTNWRDWNTLTNLTSGTEWNCRVTDQNQASGQRFYRLRHQ
jgi:outer membrane protein assembly factor BamB